MSYEVLKEVLNNYGVKGATFIQLEENMKLPQEELYQIIVEGFRTGGIENFQLNGTEVYRNRPTDEQLYGSKKSKWNFKLK